MLEPEAICAEIEAARAAGTKLTPFSARVPEFGLDDAYRIAGMLACRRAGRSPVVGRKIGFTNRSLWEAAGLDRPVWGCMYAESVLATGVPMSMDGAREPKIECEVVVRLASAPEDGERGAAVARRVAEVGFGFEVVDSPYPGWKMRPADAIAAGGIHHALALGPMVRIADPDEMSERLRDLTLTMRLDGTKVADGRGDLVMGNPLDAVGRLGELARAGGHPLEAGEVITTGTLTPPLDCRAGERYSAEAADDALPPIEVLLA